MTSTRDFRLPDVGEGLTEAELLTWHVAVGDKVAVNDTLVDIETAKSIVELPSPYAGVIDCLCVEAGTTVPVGTVIVTIRDSQTTAVAPNRDAVQLATERQEEPEEKRMVLVGTGPSAPASRRRHLRKSGEVKALQSPEPPSLAQQPPVNGQRSETRARATPPVRQLAKTLGVDLEALAARAEGMITRSDVESAAGSVEPSMAGEPAKSSPGIDPRETRVPIRGVRKSVAAAMQKSAFTAPHVTEWLTIDMTATMAMVSRLRNDPKWAGVRVTPLLFVAKAFLSALREFPGINTMWDELNQEIVLKHYVNLGIAAATPRGLLVPNIKNAGSMDFRELAEALEVLVKKAREGKLAPEEMAKGTVTITNIGALGVDAGTPILNPGEAAILAFGAVREMPWVVNGTIVPRQVTQLAMSFDHRLVDGELGSHVLAHTGRLLSDPAQAMLYA